MENRPQISRAIPKRRYQIGDVSATLLGEIESGDARNFRYILAFVPSGRREPSLYVCSEPLKPLAGPGGDHHLRVINDAMSEVIDTAPQWGELDVFVDQALKLGVQALGLSGAQVTRLS